MTAKSVGGKAKRKAKAQKEPPVKFVSTGLPKLDRILGGGIALDPKRGAVYVIRGPRGVGKTTLGLQIASALYQRASGPLWADGEMGVLAFGDLAKRLRVDALWVRTSLWSQVGGYVDLNDVCLAAKQHYCVLVIDSLSTTSAAGIPGLREGTFVSARHKRVMIELRAFARRTQMTVIVLARDPRGGAMPETDPSADVVLTLDLSSGSTALRRLRVVKNRFAPAGRWGRFVFRSTGFSDGLPRAYLGLRGGVR